jgi:uncharacterized membrane protein (UPF0127 family)
MIWKILVIGLILVIAAMIVLLKTTYPMPTPMGEFGGVSLKLEYALTEAEREKGLGDRADVPDNYGMLFVFAQNDRYGFWMKDTLVPLDIYWLNDKGQVVSMVLEVAPSTYPNVFYPAQPARYVLETAAGFGVRHQIATGTPLILQNLPRVLR